VKLGDSKYQFENSIREFISKKEFLRDTGLKDYRSSDVLVKQKIDTENNQEFEFNGLFRLYEYQIQICDFVAKITLDFRSYNSFQPPIIDVCPVTKEVAVTV